VIRTIHIDGENMRPMGMVLGPDGKQVLVTTGRGGAVVIIDANTLGLVKVVRNVGARPWGIGRTSDGSKLYTANGASGDVTVVHGATGVPLKKIRVGKFPWGIAVGP
jgi:YVTN family beta-propeller protein